MAKTCIVIFGLQSLTVTKRDPKSCKSNKYCNYGKF